MFVLLLNIFITYFCRFFLLYAKAAPSNIVDMMNIDINPMRMFTPVDPIGASKSHICITLNYLNLVQIYLFTSVSFR